MGNKDLGFGNKVFFLPFKIDKRVDFHNIQEKAVAYFDNQLEEKSDYVKYYCKNMREKFE